MKIKRKLTSAKSELTAIGAYIFAGGFTAGVSRHFKVKAHFEDGPFGVATSKKNFPGLEVFEDPRSWPGPDRVGRADFIYCNPPCAPWSAASAGRKVHWLNDPRVQCVRNAFALVGRYRPKAWCFESVRGAYTQGREMIDDMIQEARGLGYKPTCLLTEALWMGVPQRRARFFLVLTQNEVDWTPAGGDVTPCGPTLTRGVPAEPRAALGRHGDLIRELKPGGSLKELWESKNRRLVAKIEQQKLDRKAELQEARDLKLKNLAHLENQKKLIVPGRPGFQTRRIDPDRPAFTLTGGANKIHPYEDRYLSVKEHAALCGFPDDYEFVGNVGNQYAQVAKGLMPPVAEWLAKNVAAAIRSGARTSCVPEEV